MTREIGIEAGTPEVRKGDKMDCVELAECRQSYSDQYQVTGKVLPGWFSGEL